MATLTDSRKITRPFSKLNRLCGEAAKRGGKLTTFAAVADAIDLSRGHVTQMFGHGNEAAGIVVKAETVGRLVAAFRADGVSCEIDWLYLELAEFTRLVAAPAATERPAAAVKWQRHEDAVLPDLVELRVDPPVPDNEVADAYRVGGTLLFGTAVCDYDPEDGAEPRAVAIALRDARLAIGSESWRPLNGSMIGERVQSENFRRVAGGIEITGPKAADGTLDGNPVGDHYLAVIAATNAGDAPFAVTVAAGRRSFVVGDADRPAGGDPAADTKNAILNLFIYKRCGRDEAGRAVVAQATMRLCAGDAGTEC